MGERAYITRPINIIKGVSFTEVLRFILSDKNEYIRSRRSWIPKFRTIRNPREVYEIPNNRLNVVNKSGDKIEAIAIDPPVRNDA